MTFVKRSRMKKSRALQRQRRHQRLRRKVVGTTARPRLVVFRSLRQIQGQIVDDSAGTTVVGLSTLAPELRALETEGPNPKVERAFAAGKLLAERAREKGIEAVVFDRGGYQYHGRVKAFADGAREGGLTF
jgi:large subunit ribosomal protein L18